jgi:hypothetical protein
MSGYMAGQALLKTLIATNASFAAGSVVEGEISILERGVTNACILFPGTVPELDTDGLTRTVEWECLVDLLTRFTGDASYNAFGTLRDSFLATLQANPCLSDDYFITGVRSEGEPDELTDRRGEVVMFIMQRFRVTIQEQI